MTRQLLGPFSRVEGHLEIELERAEDRVISARVNSPLYRGMESIMLNRPPLDALTLAPRICGICSVSQSTAAAGALLALTNERPPKNGELVSNLVLGCEVLANHLTHFYLFFMPDFARDDYSDKDWYPEAQRFKAEKGTAQGQALEARSQLLQMMGIMAGKWPHTLSLRPGGSTKSLNGPEKHKLKTILRRFQGFLEKVVFDGPLEDILALESMSDLKKWTPSSNGDLSAFLGFSKDLGLYKLGRTRSVMMSAGGFFTDGDPLFSPGLYDQGNRLNLDPQKIKEDITHSFYNGEALQSPETSRTIPDIDKSAAYSWCKSPRFEGRRVEVGALARQVLNAHPLFVESFESQDSTVENRILARVIEMALLTRRMQDWIDKIDPTGAFYQEIALPDNGHSHGFVEAARGTLGHWLEVRSGVLHSYQIIAPTTWNFSPRDQKGQPGPLESALENCPAPETSSDPVSVQHIVRSFDPCMACTVH